MAANVTNGPAPFPKVTRGVTTKLGTITAANDAVAFTISEPTYQAQGAMFIAMTGGVTPVGILEASIDQGQTWFVVTVPTVIATSAFGDTATKGTFGPINISGMGSGALFRFGRTDATGGACVVWALNG
jgi:hypothetical protein